MADIERLVRLAYPTLTQEILEVLITDEFIDGIRDPELKKAIRLSAKRGEEDLTDIIRQVVENIDDRLSQQMPTVGIAMLLATFREIVLENMQADQERDRDWVVTSGELLPVLGQITVKIETSNQPFSHEFLVATIMVECILGLDFMQFFGLSLNIGGGTVQYGNLEIPLLGNDMEEEQIKRVLITKGTSIPAQSEAIICDIIDGNDPVSITSLIEQSNEAHSRLPVGRILAVNRNDLVGLRSLTLKLATLRRRMLSPLVVQWNLLHRVMRWPL
uniref:Uncharacterized protein n=1 Tax=Biomphalaria glabrata TaxID=6526 RepID=A0A2C9KJ80_BIOGL